MTNTSGLRRAEITRARLLEVAIQAFAERGFHGTTTRDIAGAAGMSSAALYVHHSSKEDLLYLIARQGHEKTLRLVREAIASSEVPTLALRQAVHDFVLDHARNPTSARIVNYELAALDKEHLEEIVGMRRTIENAFQKLVERGVAEGDFVTPDPQLASVALLSLGIDIGRWYHEGRRWTPEQMADFYADMALRIVGARSSSRPIENSGS
jgi:AcrR family transcriptional regulator